MRKEIAKNIGFCLGIIAIIIVVVLVFVYNTPQVAIGATPPAKFAVYFLTLNSHGHLVAYVPGHVVSVQVKVDVNAENSYVEVPVSVTNNLVSGKKDEFVSWGSGAILYVNSVGKVKSLMLSSQ